MPRKSVTQKDIAEICGVSTALVSYVLSGKAKSGRVSEAMAQRIRETAAELNYRVNTAARSLKGKPQMIIGCVVADISNPFFSTLARKIEDECYRLGYTVIFGSSDEQPDKLARVVDAMLDRQVDGLLITPPAGSAATIAYINKLGVPLVLVDRRGPTDAALPYVGIDNAAASYALVRRLSDLGYRRIGMVGHDSPLEHFQERLRGYTAALQDGGLPTGPELQARVTYERLNTLIPRQIDRLLDEEKVEALFFGSNSLALTGLRHLFQRGCRLPEDVEVAAFDDHEIYDFFSHPIVHVRQPLEEIGRQSVKLLLEEIADPQSADQQQIVLTATLHPEAKADPNK